MAGQHRRARPLRGAAPAAGIVRRHLGPAVLDQEHRVRRRVLRRLEGLLHGGRLRRRSTWSPARWTAPTRWSLAGNVTVGLSAPDATARFITEQGAPLKIIGSTFQKNPFCILSLEEGKPIRTPADLVGKTIGIQAGTNQSIFAGFLKANSIDPASLDQVVVQYDPTPLTEKKVDGFMAFLTNEPFLRQGRRASPRSRWPSPTTGCR